MLKKNLTNGKTIESIGLTPSQFERACQLYQTDGMRSNGDSLECVEGCSLMELSEEEKSWLKLKQDEGADIYTYRIGWQDIAEIAVLD